MMNILVTGANGQLGQCLRDIVEGDNSQNNTWFWTDVSGVEGRKCDYLDITDEESVRKYFVDNAISVCINCAAYTNVDKAEEDPETAKKLNADAPKILADACNIHGAKLIHISTDYVFNGTEFFPITEDRLTFPMSVYGKTKLEGEQNIINSGCKYLIFRTAWLYSEYGKNFVKTVIDLTLSGKDMHVVNDQVGSPTYARNLAAFIWYIIEWNYLLTNGTYHFTDEGVASWYDLAYVVREFVLNRLEAGYIIDGYERLGDVKPISTKDFYGEKKHAPRPYYSVLNKGKARRDFGNLYDFPHWKEGVWVCVNKIMNEKRIKE